MQRETANVVDSSMKQQGEPFLRRPKRGHDDEYPRRHLYLPKYSRKKSRRRERVRERKVPRLSQRVVGLCSRRIAPSVKSMEKRRIRGREEIDRRKTPATDEKAKDVRSQMPIRQRPETRRRVREKIFLGGDEDWKDPDRVK